MTPCPYGLEALRRYREQRAKDPQTTSTPGPETENAQHRGLEAAADDEFDFDDLLEQ